jgi:ethanolamine phosphate phosphodiesterase
MLVADPQLLNLQSYPDRPLWVNALTRFIVDYNMKKSWRVARKLKPSTIIFLGDLMDNGRLEMTDAQYVSFANHLTTKLKSDRYNKYVLRFNNTFATGPSVSKLFIPGNHDVGFVSSFETYSDWSSVIAVSRTQAGSHQMRKIVGSLILVNRTA